MNNSTQENTTPHSIKKMSLLSIIALSAGIISVILSALLIGNNDFIAFLLCLFALIFGIIGIIKKTGKKNIVTVVLAVISLIIIGNNGFNLGATDLKVAKLEKEVSKSKDSLLIAKAFVVASSSALDGSAQFSYQTFNELGDFFLKVDNQADWFKKNYTGTIYIKSTETKATKQITIADDNHEHCAVLTFQSNDDSYDQLGKWSYEFKEYGDFCKGYKSFVSENPPTSTEKKADTSTIFY